MLYSAVMDPFGFRFWVRYLGSPVAGPLDPYPFYVWEKQGTKTTVRLYDMEGGRCKIDEKSSLSWSNEKTPGFLISLEAM